LATNWLLLKKGPVGQHYFKKRRGYFRKTAHFLSIFLKNDRFRLQSLPLRVQSKPLREQSLSLREHSLPLGSRCFAILGAIFAAWIAIPAPSGAILAAGITILAAWIGLIRDFGCHLCRLDRDPSPFGCSLSGKDRAPNCTFGPEKGRRGRLRHPDLEGNPLSQK